MPQMKQDEVLQAIHSVKSWYHRIEVAPGIVTPGINDSSSVLKLLGLPRDCKGMRVLDIGARDGFFSFELERRGAEVVALDHIGPDDNGFNVAKRLLGSKVTHVQQSVYEVSPDTLGEFDLVLFLGVLYHLRDPMLALDTLWRVLKPGGKLFLESHVCDQGFLNPETQSWVPLASYSPQLANVPIMQFYPGSSMNNDPTNWWGPNMACLAAMLKMCIYEVEYERLEGYRGIFRARKIRDTHLEYYRQIEKSVVPRGRA